MKFFKKKRALTDQDQMLAALEAAAYMRWVETRQNNSPTDRAVDLYISGILDRERLNVTTNDVKTIAILALTMNMDLVHSYIDSTKFFDRLDQAAKQASPNS